MLRGQTTFIEDYNVGKFILGDNKYAAYDHRANTKVEDGDFGLLNEGHRYRHLEYGVFLTPDPKEYIDGLNQYIYCNQNPWGRFDPEGLNMQQFTYSCGPAALQYLLENKFGKKFPEKQVRDVYRVAHKQKSEGYNSPGSQDASFWNGRGMDRNYAIKTLEVFEKNHGYEYKDSVTFAQLAKDINKANKDNKIVIAFLEKPGHAIIITGVEYDKTARDWVFEVKNYNIDGTEVSGADKEIESKTTPVSRRDLEKRHGHGSIDVLKPKQDSNTQNQTETDKSKPQKTSETKEKSDRKE